MNWFLYAVFFLGIRHFLWLCQFKEQCPIAIVKEKKDVEYKLKFQLKWIEYVYT